MTDPETKSNIFAAIDIGTNSIRLAVIRVEAGGRWTTLSVQREVVRLGDGEFEQDLLTPEAIDRGTLVCSQFARIARGYGAGEIVAFATSAVREAENRDKFIERVLAECGIQVHVISGVEEARLIWLGVSSGIDFKGRSGLLIDIGGGSTEMIVGSVSGHQSLDSVRLGAIRLSNRFFNDAEPVGLDYMAKVKSYVEGAANHAIRRVKAAGFDFAVGSAGTINALAAIIERRTDEPIREQSNPTFSIAELQDTVAMLCRLPLSERRKVAGMDANRADIILGGAAIILTLMEQLEISRLMVSDRGLREGILLDHVLREEGVRLNFQSQSVRRRSILQLAQVCKYDEVHALQIARLALRLFDESARLGLHDYGAAERELLEYAALTHDIGAFLSQSNHHKHAYYMIRNYDLLGFNESEVEIIANVAMYHHNRIPRKSHSNLMDLDRASRKSIEVLSALLRVAEGLDRSHQGLVRSLDLHRREDPDRLELELYSSEECHLELWAVQQKSESFERTFGLPLTAIVHPLTVQRKEHASELSAVPSP